MSAKVPVSHFHNGHSLEVWCGRKSKHANWTTVPEWVTCHDCLRQMRDVAAFSGSRMPSLGARIES